MGDVVYGDFKTTLDITVDTILEGNKGKLQKAIIIGVDNDGKDFLASSVGDEKEVLLMLELGKFNFLRMVAGDNDDAT